MKTIRLSFESRLAASSTELWAWSTSHEGVGTEMRPLLRMTFPASVGMRFGEHIVPGKPLCHCWLLLFGLIPIDRSELTFLEFEPGRRFVEQSPMLSMKRWRHERVVMPAADGAVLADHLEFAPRFGAPLVKIFVKLFFERRHAALRRRFGSC